ncbi:MAG: hypothetical protein RIT45_338 [Pseudomonadota bacterium]|jgi:CheY-like chemotaxis protein
MSGAADFARAYPVLYVDDEVDNLLVFRATFRDELEVLTASGGEEALQLMDRTPGIAILLTDQRMPGMSGVDLCERVAHDLPDVVVSDVMMPRLDGLGLVRALREQAETAHIGIILVTALHGQEPLLEGYAARCDDFVRKPFAADELLARVATQVRLRHLQQTLVRAEKAQLLSALSAGMAHEVLNPVNA